MSEVGLYILVSIYKSGAGFIFPFGIYKSEAVFIYPGQYL